MALKTNWNIQKYNYSLPPEKIATHPLPKRDHSKLLRYDVFENKIEDYNFWQLPNLLEPNSVLLNNNAKVVLARMLFQNENGANIEIFYLEPENTALEEAFQTLSKIRIWAFVKNRKKWRNKTLTKSLKNIKLSATCIEEAIENKPYLIELNWNQPIPFIEILNQFGKVPLPPYIKRDTELKDKDTYQTLFATKEGSVAAPTAGLHFSDDLITTCKQKPVHFIDLTLHVGAGTFMPVKSNTIKDHTMHAERIEVNKKQIDFLLDHLNQQRICIGTTSLRAIESLYWLGVYLTQNSFQNNFTLPQWYPYQNQEEISIEQSFENVRKHAVKSPVVFQSQLMIAPTYKPKWANGLITNFHQPKSTLLVLVSALVGEKWKDIYNHALENDYRFLSYGDACFFTWKGGKNY